VFDAENEEGHEQEGKPRGDGDECKEGKEQDAKPREPHFIQTYFV
jgi:hypothetical protein